ncbi:agmatinase [Candidatus Woesearchaeota archaeon]|nr:agmatinase [Candidatus Woesearchaeota archaeon]
MEPHFSSPFNFGAIPRELSAYGRSKVVILPVPYDASTTYRSGAREGPYAIIAASRNMELYDAESGRNFSGVGICTLDELDILVDPEKMCHRVYEAVSALVSDGKFVVLLGGEHSLSFGSARAHAEQHPGLSVLHIDAHGDLRDENGGSRFDHGCVARRISEICPIVQVGIRSLGQEEAEFIRKSGHTVIYAADMQVGHNWMDEAIDALSDTVFVTFDIDAMDPSLFPATGTPEPGGMHWYQALAFLKRLSERRKVVGFDLVELSPQAGNVSADYSAAKLAYKMIGMFAR